VPGGPRAHYSPAAWSPDGSQLAVGAREWQRDQNGPSHTSLWVANLRSGKWRRITTAEPSARVAVGARELAWGPDGRQLAFEAYPPLQQSVGNSRIWVVRVDGTGLRPLTPGPVDRSPAWSPDGQWIAYISDRADEDWEDFPSLSLARLNLVSHDGKRHATNLARVDAYSNLSWTPQGELLYQRCNAILLGTPRLP
jgi:Tol biopolymer transport system component